jgi:hypothetical protein
MLVPEIAVPRTSSLYTAARSHRLVDKEVVHNAQKARGGYLFNCDGV